MDKSHLINLCSYCVDPFIFGFPPMGNIITWQDLILLPPLLVFGTAEELCNGPGEAVVGQPGVFLPDEQSSQETLSCLLIVLNRDL